MRSMGSRLESLMEMDRWPVEPRTKTLVGETPQPTPSPDPHGVPLAIQGQGAVAFEVQQIEDGKIDHYEIVLKESEKSPWLVRVTITDESVTAEPAGGQPKTEPVPMGTHLIRFPESSMFIWVSVDRGNDRITVGHGYLMQKNTLLTLDLPPEERRMGNVPAAAVERGLVSRLRWVGIADQVKVASAKRDRMPVTIDTPPAIVEHNRFTLDQLEENVATVASALPQEAQILYGTVAGRGVVLSQDDAAAIDYSVRTEGMTLWKKLAAKRHEFGGDPQMVYIRGTVGPQQGNSPGVPFVVEIWPPGCYSPVHNHGNTVAVIKVLHGRISVTWYNPLAQDRNPKEPPSVGTATFSAGAVTWITPEMYQTHQLRNPSDTTSCVTIQSYRYLDDDNAHYEFFDYVSPDPSTTKLQHFRPDSDFDYAKLLTIVHWEYERKRPYPDPPPLT